MTHARIDLRRSKKGPVVAILFGATLTDTTLTAEVMFVPAPIKRSIKTTFETHKLRMPALNPDLYGAIFGSDVPTLEVIRG